MSLIHCTSDCAYQNEGYCRLDKAAEISSGPNNTDCLHFKAKDKQRNDTPVKADDAISK
jgi:hypothetical protein